MTSDPLVAIILVNWFGGPDTVACLESLAGQSHGNWIAVVVDNGSTDGSPAQIAAAMKRLAAGSGDEWSQVNIDEMRRGGVAAKPSPRYVLIDAGANLGFAAGNNIGMKWALAEQAEYIWVLNNDTEVHHNALSALIQRLRRGKASVAGSVLAFHDDRTRLQCIGGAHYNFLLARGHQVGEGEVLSGNSPIAEPENLTYIAGASMLVASDTVRHVGGMNERYFLYFEELDWMRRLWRFGPPVVATDSLVYHKEGASIGTASRSLRSCKSQFYMARNLVLFYRWHHPVLLPIALMRNLREMLRFACGGHWKHVRVCVSATLDGIMGRFGYKGGL